MKITMLNVAAMVVAANLTACGGEPFPCKAGEVLTATGLCTDPTDLVPKEKSCAEGQLETSDGFCVAPEQPWEFPCNEDEVLREDGSCVKRFPCEGGNVLTAAGTCVPLTPDERDRIAQTSRVYVSRLVEEYQETRVPDSSYTHGTGLYRFHAVDEAFLITSVALTWYSTVPTFVSPPSWISSHNVGYNDEGDNWRWSSLEGYPDVRPIPVQLFVPKGGAADLATWIHGNFAVCQDYTGFTNIGMALRLDETYAVGLTTGKHITLSENDFDLVHGNRVLSCGTGLDPRAP